ncbi:thioredoxin domain-containing protein [Erythrobacter sp. F6033]|uniref:thioredoxin domain-containing protein n=1 Tax=Erythrobacter sp. F6033 TaxID=2926401 RepID=UPI001FF6D430|nr:thioredoxin domain-containing protein [Erythrobacter sp. F6033]MCK0127914.1 DsbA family protein [Erythrobacter sp. F6033]
MTSIRSNMTRRAIAFGMTAPIALALAACGSDPAEAGTEAGEPIAAIDAPEGTSWTETVTVSEEGGYVLGNPDAPIKLVEYASHTCGACAQFAATAKPSIKADYVSTGVVSFEQRNLVRDPIDLSIATLVRCGTKENMQPLSDQAWASLDGIFQNVQQNGAAYEAAGNLPVDQRFVAIGQAAGLIEFFSARGLSADQARTCLADTETIEGIAEASSTQAQELGVQATPTFFLNGRKLEERSWAQLEPILQRAGARTE